MWFKIKTEDKSFILDTWYRQWEPIYREILEEHGIYVMNKKPTWFRGNRKSLINHIATNAHQHIDNITTTPP